jgi:3'-phosphoadenosine 5'-phosphosulfate sulfotransferase (PAPS reductase)/FAD synthetase
MSHEDFLADKTLAARMPRDRIEATVDRAAAQIKAAAAGRSPAFGWSGGKDSVVIRLLCDRAGIQECVMGISALEYPAFLRWATAHMPPRLEVIKNHSLNLDWLAANPHMLFPATANIASQWFHRVQHHAQTAYARKHKLDLLILGRRRAEGNYIGVDGSYRKGDLEVLSPIADWSHVLLFAVIQHYKLPLAPFYRWPRGYRCGTHPWPARQWCRSVQDGWREIHAIDPQIVSYAATKLPSAARFLETIGKCAVYSGGSEHPAMPVS